MTSRSSYRSRLLPGNQQRNVECTQFGGSYVKNSRPRKHIPGGRIQFQNEPERHLDGLTVLMTPGGNRPHWDRPTKTTAEQRRGMFGRGHGRGKFAV